MKSTVSPTYVWPLSLISRLGYFPWRKCRSPQAETNEARRAYSGIAQGEQEN
jgi:hypothetical protein